MIVGIKLEYNANEDEVLEWLDDLTEGKSERSFIGWAKRVEELANQGCNDNENENVRVRIRRRGNVGLDFEFSDRDAIECAINATHEVTESMPQFLKGFYKEIISDLKEHKNGKNSKLNSQF